jgi:hypothetical protein
VVGGGKFSNGAQTGAFRYLFNESIHHGKKQGIPISDHEKALAGEGTQASRLAFWQSRYSRGDTFALTALKVIDNHSYYMISNLSSPINNKQLGINLMVDYVDWIDRDYADTNPNNWRGILSNDQITAWHDYSFARTPWSTVYIGRYSSVCDHFCDSYNPK